MALSLNRGTAVEYWRGPSAAPAVQLAAPHGSFPGIQDSIRPPWLVVEPKSAIKAATAEETDVTSLRGTQLPVDVHHKKTTASL